uniref:GPN-loop GTPase 3 n=1 Tax=Henneguya salminicola TaxID=69463 RepID=A0A6G3MH05_HENSL
MKVAQIVIGPAGCGKSTYASRMFEHLIDSKRCVCLVNLDPAAEEFICQPDIDIRELISLTDVMEDDEIKLGPNGGLIFCIEYLIKNIDWLFKKIDEFLCDYLIFDCPGQVELYTHMPSFRILLEHLKYNDFNVCAMYMIDSQFMVDPCKFIGGVVSALSAMVMFEVPHVNILTKIDLLDETMKSKLEDYLNFSSEDMLAELNQVIPPRYLRLNKELALLVMKCNE